MRRGVASPPVQGATVLHCLARLYETAIQGATKGATKCNIGCYILKVRLESAKEEPEDSSISAKTREEPRQPDVKRCGGELKLGLPSAAYLNRGFR